MRYHRVRETSWTGLPPVLVASHRLILLVGCGVDGFKGNVPETFLNRPR